MNTHKRVMSPMLAFEVVSSFVDEGLPADGPDTFEDVIAAAWYLRRHAPAEIATAPGRIGRAIMGITNDELEPESDWQREERECKAREEEGP